MISKEQAWELIRELNEEAHDDARPLWMEADELEDEDPDEAEDMRSQASTQQAHHFRGYLEDHPGLKEACMHYAEQDEEFKEEWDAWYHPWLDQWLND